MTETSGDPANAVDVDTWQSGWLVIRYGEQVHGFAELDIEGPGVVDASIYVMASDGEVHQTFRIRYDRHQHTAKWQTNTSDEDPSGWDTEEQVTIPDGQRPHLESVWQDDDTIEPDQLFTTLAALFADHFIVLTSVDPADLYWDHHWHQGPADTNLWTPTGLDRPSPFAQQTGLEHP